MQKQLLIREKKRAASRLESKAAAFEDKKKALQVRPSLPPYPTHPYPDPTLT